MSCSKECSHEKEGKGHSCRRPSKKPRISTARPDPPVLPTEVWICIWDLVDDYYLGQCAQVDRRWRAYFETRKARLEEETWWRPAIEWTIEKAGAELFLNDFPFPWRTPRSVDTALRTCSSAGFPLIYLDLSGNRLEVLPPELADFKSLQFLILSGNLLKTVPPELFELGNLTNLVLSFNILEIVPQELAELGNLRNLNLSHNRLKQVPAVLSKLRRLERLILDNNRLETVPRELGGLSDLRHLDLSQNLLEIIPPELGELGNMRILYLSHNLLKTLPPELGDLGNLTHMHLSDNPLEYLPRAIGMLYHQIYDRMSFREISDALKCHDFLASIV